MNWFIRALRWLGRNWHGECQQCGRKLLIGASGGGYCAYHGDQ